MLPDTSAVDALYSTAKWLLDGGRELDAADVFRVMLMAAPNDERGWLGIGACHDAIHQQDIAIELYRLGAQASKSARCHIARARLLRALERSDEALDALAVAEALADENDDDELQRLVADERSIQ